MPSLLNFIHSLRKPMLRRNYILEAIPLRNDDLPKLSKISKSKNIRFLTF